MSSAQKPPTVNDDERARDIYRQAAEIIYEKGFEATSMGEIADTVGLTKGGLYYYIKGKRALLYAIMSYAMNLVEEEVVRPALEERDPEARLASLVAGHVRLMLREPCAMSILAQEDESLDEEHRDKVRARKERSPGVLRDAIREVLERQGRGSAIDPGIAAYSLLGMIHWIGRWHQTDGRLTENDVVAQLTHVALHGLIPEPGRVLRK